VRPLRLARATIRHACGGAALETGSIDINVTAANSLGSRESGRALGPRGSSASYDDCLTCSPTAALDFLQERGDPAIVTKRQAAFQSYGVMLVNPEKYPP